MPSSVKKNTEGENKLIDITALDSINELLGSPRALYWLNFKTGFIRGLSGLIGAAVAIIIIGLLVTVFGGLPIIGHFFQSLAAAAKVN
ncbi:MAG: DUF5665 domain-containing protein [Candidatus Saccharibacteria bacterium]